MRVARRSATSRIWVVRITAAPCAARACSISFTRREEAASSPVKGSSRSRNLRLVDQRAGEHGFLLHAARKPLAALVPVRPQAERFQQFLGAALSRSLGRHAPQAGDEFQIFHRAQPVVEQRLVGQPGHDGFGRQRVGQHIAARTPRCCRHPGASAPRSSAGWWFCRRRWGRAAHKIRRAGW